MHPLAKTLLTLSALLATLSAGNTSRAAELALSMSADTWIRSDNVTFNGNNSLLAIGQVAGGGDTRSLLSFDFSGASLPVDAVFVSAKLVLYLNGADSTSIDTTLTVNLHELTTSFVESTATWNRSAIGSDWAIPGGDYSGDILASTTVSTKAPAGDVTWSGASLDSIVQTALADGTALNFLLKVGNENENTSRQLLWFASGADNSAARPVARLVLEYTVIPEPGSVALFTGAAALASVTFLRRRRRAS